VLKYHDEILGLQGRRVAVARFVSRTTPAPFINLYVGIIMSYFPPNTLGPFLSPSESLLICLIMMVATPVLPILIQARRGKVDLDVSVREMRTRFFLFSLACYVAAYAVYWSYQCDVMRVLAAAYFGVTLGVMLATLRTKVSVHAAGVAGPGTALIYVYGMAALPVVILWIAVVWARRTLRQHTLAQLVGGMLIGIAVTLAVYWMMYPI
jgi:membrane-associated phospholipid phosphatase